MTFKVAKDIVDINNALFQVTHGLYILTARKEGKINGQCLDACMQVTNNPPRIAIGVGKKSLTHEMIIATGQFVVNVIDREDPCSYDCVKHFGFQSGRNVDKFANIKFEIGVCGLPILPSAKAYYECEVIPEKMIDLETHTLFIGQIKCAGVSDHGEPLTYNEYRKNLKKTVRPEQK